MAKPSDKKSSKGPVDPKVALINEINSINELGLNRWEKERFRLSLDQDSEGHWILTDKKISYYLKQKVLEQDKSFRHSAEKYLYETVRHSLLELMLFDDYAHPTFKKIAQELLNSIQEQLVEASPPPTNIVLSKGQICSIVRNAFIKVRESGLISFTEKEQWHQEYNAICNGFGWYEKQLEWRTELSRIDISKQSSKELLGKVSLAEKFHDLVLNQLQKKTSIKYHARGKLEQIIAEKN